MNTDTRVCHREQEASQLCTQGVLVNRARRTHSKLAPGQGTLTLENLRIF